jgi:hypothetical protein
MAAGVKTGGRVKGTPNAAPAARAARRAAPAPDNTLVSQARGRAREAKPAVVALASAQPKRVGRPRNPPDPGFPKQRTVWIADLIPYANNARTHSPQQIAALAASIRKFGWTNPVLTDGKRGIIAGHGRLLAAQSLGWESVSTIELTHMTADERQAYVLADNVLAQNAGWDEDLKASELVDLVRKGFDVGVIGFGDDKLAALLDDEAEPAPVVKLSKEVTCPHCKRSFRA